MYIFISVSFKKLFEKNLQNTITDCIVGIIKGLEAVIDEKMGVKYLVISVQHIKTNYRPNLVQD